MPQKATKIGAVFQIPPDGVVEVNDLSTTQPPLPLWGSGSGDSTETHGGLSSAPFKSNPNFLVNQFQQYRLAILAERRYNLTCKIKDTYCTIR